MKTVVLASTSPYRRQLLARLQIPFDTFAPTVDETPITGELPDARALRLAEEKALAAAAAFPQSVIIGGDQTISGGGRIFDKPGNAERAMAQLREMRGCDCHFFTAVAVLDAAGGNKQSCLVSHKARFRMLADDEIARYVEKENAVNCAGGAQIEGLGVSLLESMEGGDPTAIIGMPLIHVAAMLRQYGVQIP